MNLIPNTRRLRCCQRSVRIRSDLNIGDVIGTTCCGTRWRGVVVEAALPGYLRIEWTTPSKSYDPAYKAQQQRLAYDAADPVKRATRQRLAERRRKAART